MTTDFAWAAGLIEGEGSFIRTSAGKPQFGLQTTDEDVARRLADVLGLRVNGPYSNDRSGLHPEWKPIWALKSGSFERVQYIVGVTWSQLGSRRRAQARRMLGVD